MKRYRIIERKRGNKVEGYLIDKCWIIFDFWFVQKFAWHPVKDLISDEPIMFETISEATDHIHHLMMEESEGKAKDTVIKEF